MEKKQKLAEYLVQTLNLEKAEYSYQQIERGFQLRIETEEKRTLLTKENIVDILDEYYEQRGKKPLTQNPRIYTLNEQKEIPGIIQMNLKGPSSNIYIPEITIQNGKGIIIEKRNYDFF